jgi:hypothetical protein
VFVTAPNLFRVFSIVAAQTDHYSTDGHSCTNVLRARALWATPRCLAHVLIEDRDHTCVHMAYRKSETGDDAYARRNDGTAIDATPTR